MKLIQLNTWSCKLPTQVVRLFEEQRPDFVCLQEAISANFNPMVMNTIEQVFEKYAFADVLYTPLIEFAFMKQRMQRGNMIASQSKILDSSEVWTHGSFNGDFDIIEAQGVTNGSRNIVHARVATSDGIVNILTLHGYIIKEHKNGNEETLKACKQLVSFAETLDGPVIITGDFNLAPDSESIQYVNQKYRNLSIEYNLPTTRNYLTSKTEVCDYIFVNEKVQVNNFFMSEIVASDHNALVLDFDIVQ